MGTVSRYITTDISADSSDSEAPAQGISGIYAPAARICWTRIQPTMRVLLLAGGAVGGWIGGTIVGYLVVALVAAISGDTPMDLTLPLLLAALGAGIGIAVVGRSLR